MLKSYFVIAIRSLLKNKPLTGINILGLSIGISASLVIYLLVNYHFTFDKFEKDNDCIYRVVSNFVFSGQAYHNSGVCDPMGAAVKREITGLDAVVPFRKWNGDVKVTVPAPGKSSPAIFKHQKNVVLADSNYFDMVGYTWVAGSSKIALNNPCQVVLAESSAKLFFPELTSAQIVGKQMYFNDSIGVTVSGIVKDIEKNTDFNFKVFVAYTTLQNTTLKPENWNHWGSTNGAQQLFVKLSANTSTAQIEKQIADLYNKNNKREAGDNSKTWHTLQPLSDVHFNADYGVFDGATAHKPTLYGLLAVAAFLLLLGCINFINLSTAYAEKRAKEIGIRKTMGSSKQQLVIQFLSETFLFTLLAAALSLLFTPVILKAFAGFIPESLHFSLKEQPGVLVFIPLLICIVALLSGIYPAFVLSGYKPVLVLKNQAYSGIGKTRNAWLRKSLTVSQFVIAQVFIMGAIIVSKQISYSLNKDLGFKKDAIVFIRTNVFDTVKANKFVLIDKLKAMPDITMVSLNNNPPSTNNTWSGTIKYKDGKKEIETDVQQKYGDTNYIKLYGLKLLAGKNYTQTDTVQAFLINETYAHILGFKQPEEAVGKYLEWNDKRIPVAGVVADFHQKSLHETIKPLVIGSWNNVEDMISIAIQPKTAGNDTWKKTISKVEGAFKTIYPQDEFTYTFFDEDLVKYYDAEKNIAVLLKWATGLAIFISCLGLFGLIVYTTTQRTKEIGVRKVLGASVAGIVSLISKEFILLVTLAFIIATPLAWLGMHKWLESFAYRTSISWWVFIMAGAVMTLIALLTISFQTIKAAIANPVKALRTE